MKDPSEGARLLRLAKELHGLTEEEIEERLAARAATYSLPSGITAGGGCSNRYMSGERTPDLLRAICAEDEFKIPVRSWFTPPATRRGKNATARHNVQKNGKASSQEARR